jgi:hypothetical protein
MGLYELYVRFMVWLGAAPPPGYEHLLSKDVNKSKSILERSTQPPKQYVVSQYKKLPKHPTPQKGEGVIKNFFSRHKLRLKRSPGSPKRIKEKRTPFLRWLKRPSHIKSVLEQELYANLLTKCLGDKERVERLIEYERKRTPNASEEEFLQSAIDRWERDNK